MYIVVRASWSSEPVAAKLKRIGGRLAEPRDAATNSFLKRLIPEEIFVYSKRRQARGPYFGLTRDKFRRWVWASDGSPLRYSNWMRSYPSGQRIVMYGKRPEFGQYGWRDSHPPGANVGYIAEFDF